MEFHFSAKGIRAGVRGGAQAVSAYIAGRSSIDGLRINNPHRSEDIAFSGLTLPWRAREMTAVGLWRAADLAERKKDGEYRMNGGHAPILASHADLALPWGINEAEARHVVHRICQHLVCAHGVGVEFAVHRKAGRIDHVHFLWSTRLVTQNGLGAKARTLNAIAQRKTGNTNPSAMEVLRELASKAIYESTKTHWDHRSYKRRGIDKTAEPKLDRRLLREQRRKKIKLGDSQATEIEQKLQTIRDKKMRDGTELYQNQILASLVKSIDKLNEGQERTMQILDGILRHSVGSVAIKSQKAHVKVDPPNLASLTVSPKDPRKIAKDEQQSVATAIYGRMHNNPPLENAGILMLQQIRNISASYAQWWIRCYVDFINSRELPAPDERQYARPYTNLDEWQLRMEEIRRERRLNEEDDALPPTQIPMPGGLDPIQQTGQSCRNSPLTNHQR